MAAVIMEDKIMMELLHSLIDEERRGYTYFREAAKVATEVEIRRLFEWLTTEEQRHLEVLKTIQAQFESQVKSTRRRKSIVMDDKMVRILDLSDMAMEEVDLPHLELFRGQDFADLFKKISTGTVLQYAMKIEYENAAYIKLFFQYVTSKKHRDLLISLIENEKEHFLELKKVAEVIKP